MLGRPVARRYGQNCLEKSPIESTPPARWNSRVATNFQRPFAYYGDAAQYSEPGIRGFHSHIATLRGFRAESARAPSLPPIQSPVESPPIADKLPRHPPATAQHQNCD